MLFVNSYPLLPPRFLSFQLAKPVHTGPYSFDLHAGSYRYKAPPDITVSRVPHTFLQSSRTDGSVSNLTKFKLFALPISYFKAVYSYPCHLL